MNALTTYRVTVHLSTGQTIVTEEAAEELSLIDELLDRIEDRDDPWKVIGHVAVNFRNIVAIEVEQLSTDQRR